ncbi:DNA ligase 1 [Phytophthora citrophthora]|uniref:DNA ligase 1 n=1 Tax=Phytophthora citrophthora TaxID=4793 RepID=A0AAD9LGA1_9STRA|nr:DNA ligase 1 [Phytophthora citrophthora]
MYFAFFMRRDSLLQLDILPSIMLIARRRGWLRARVHISALRKLHALQHSVSSASESLLHDTPKSGFKAFSGLHNTGSFEALARTFAAIEDVKNSRVASVQLLADGYRQLLDLPTPDELASALYLTASQLAPPYEGLELRFGAKSFVRFLRLLDTHQDGDLDSKQTLEKLLATYPDYGQATQALLDSRRLIVPVLEETSEPLSIQSVHDQLIAMAKDEGTGGVARKQQLALKLLQQCRCSEERVILSRMLAHQNLRIGMGEKSILSALAMASAPLTEEGEELSSSAVSAQKDWVDCVTLAYAQHPNYRVLADIVHASQHEKDIERRMEWLHDKARPATGVPVLTMSAYPVSSVAAVLERVSKSTGHTATCEYKYDGARVQVHLSLSDTKRNRIFSRNMEDVTERYSSLLDVLEKRVAARNGETQRSPVSSLIVEGEVVALDRETSTFLPFQVLQTKTTTDFCLFLFDLIAVDDANLLQKPLRQRRELLHNLVEQDPGYVEFVKHVDIGLTAEDTAETAESVRRCLEQAVAGGCEGLMIKALDDEESEYKAGRRSYSWMKLKHDYLSDEQATSSSSAKKPKAANSSGNGTFLADTLDLVPIGAFHGKGRRAGVFGSFLMATYNSTSGKFETIGKVGTGFSDAQLTEVATRLEKQILPETDVVPEQYQSIAIRSRHPDVWLSPEEVWEIKATQLTESPSYTCGSNESAARKGLALRFPRFVRFRTDKKPLQATESEEVLELFNQQQQVQN